MGNILRRKDGTYQTLTDGLLEHCRNITGFSDDEIRAEHRKFFSLVNDGRLKKSHFNDVLGEYLSSTKKKYSTYLAHCVFSAIDTNDDGYIDFLECLISMKFFQ